MANDATTGRLTPPVSGRDHARGADDAAVTLLEYGDYECPHCGEAHEVVRRLQSSLGAGRVRFVFRHFPLAQIHAHAQHAAEAAEAAGAQGKFWEMHDLLFARQGAIGDGDLAAYAAELGLDFDRFLRDLSKHVHAARVREDMRGGLASGVSGTPTFFINGELQDAAWRLDVLLEAIRRAA